MDSKRMVINIKQGKGNKDLLTILGDSVLTDLRVYYIKYKPKAFLFEGQKKQKLEIKSLLTCCDTAMLRTY